ncbi:multidrug effflux MFS transporter [Alkalicoccobacillus murimartini]|uniref:Bcr/CflA family efflux transporter n=1 Tax=Alkalicoccobacillus murimartini TaxID=171685 RepID=A0ABT9YMW3_9BACI|nr:multidrug effflux MFS transporter [Alkalicoccobacillus murimartini]MDQ0209212.1 DHA1 family bicyclomycin/chloramphenicol resistance-like MFS transporter [Alkalicoccobacillus murimartini]
MNQIDEATQKRSIPFLRTLLILGSLAAFGPLTIDMYLPAFPQIEQDFVTSASFTQLSLTACLLGLALGQIIVGPISDVRGRKGPLVIALVAYIISSILCALSPSIWMLIILRFIQGLAGAAGIVLSRASIRDLYSGAELTKFFAMLMLITGTAPILAPVVGGQLLQWMPWQGVFFVLAGIGMIVMISVILGLPDTLAPENRSTGGLQELAQTFKGLVRNKLFIGYAATQGLVGAGMFSYISGSSFVLQNVYDVSAQTYGYLFAVNGAGLILASQATGRLAGRFGEKRLLAVGLMIATIGAFILLLAVLFTNQLILVMIGLFLAVSSVGIVGPSCFSLAMRDQQKSAGSAAALLGLMQYIIGAAAAPFVGIAGSSTALPMAIIILICEIGAVIVFLSLVRTNQSVDA